MLETIWKLFSHHSGLPIILLFNSLGMFLVLKTASRDRLELRIRAFLGVWALASTYGFLVALYA